MRRQVGAARTASRDMPRRYLRKCYSFSWRDVECYSFSWCNDMRGMHHSSSFFLKLLAASDTRPFHFTDETLSQRMRPS